MSPLEIYNVEEHWSIDRQKSGNVHAGKPLENGDYRRLENKIYPPKFERCWNFKGEKKQSFDSCMKLKDFNYKAKRELLLEKEESLIEVPGRNAFLNHNYWVSCFEKEFHIGKGLEPGKYVITGNKPINYPEDKSLFLFYALKLRFELVGLYDLNKPPRLSVHQESYLVSCSMEPDDALQMALSGQIDLYENLNKVDNSSKKRAPLLEPKPSDFCSTEWGTENYEDEIIEKLLQNFQKNLYDEWSQVKESEDYQKIAAACVAVPPPPVCAQALSAIINAIFLGSAVALESLSNQENNDNYQCDKFEDREKYCEELRKSILKTCDSIKEIAKKQRCIKAADISYNQCIEE
jgi:hypothetical protein